MSTTTERAARTLKPLDFLDVDALLSSEERMIRDTVRQFVRERVMPGIEEWFENGIFPSEMAAEMGGLGLIGMHLSGYGWPGTNAVSYGLSCMELGGRGRPVRRFVVVRVSRARVPM